MSGQGVTDSTGLGGNLRHGDDGTFCPRVWSYLIERFAVRSVLDVGAGEGHAVHWFNTQGVYAVGIDGLWDNVRRAVAPIIHHDVTKRQFHMPVDLVWSCEVAEHIEERFVEDYIDTLINGKVVAMTHATPGQGGFHHVNEQPSSYWIEKLQARGYGLATCTAQTRLLDNWPTYFATSGLVFARNG